jgi:hypothetical protein
VQNLLVTVSPGGNINSPVSGNYQLLDIDNNKFTINEITGQINVSNSVPPNDYILFVRYINTLNYSNTQLIVRVITNTDIIDETTLITFLESTDQQGLITVPQITMNINTQLINLDGELKNLVTSEQTQIVKILD